MLYPYAPMSESKTTLAAVLALPTLVLALFVADCGPAAVVPAEKADFRLESLDGAAIGPPDFPGQVVVVDFWATWCTPCRAQASILEDVHAEWGSRGVQFLAVDVAEERELVEEFVASNPFPYPVLLDPDDELSAALGLMALPTLMVIDREGQVIYFESGVMDGRRLGDLIRQGGAAA